MPTRESEWPMENMLETVKQPRPARTVPAQTVPVSKTVSMKATPLERPAQPASKKPVQQSTPRTQKTAEKQERSYSEVLRRQKRTMRRPLSTGNDRV